MVLLLASLQEFKLFLQIVLWIAVPLIIVSFVVTTILHYRQKRKNALLGNDNPQLPDGGVDISIVSRLQKEVLHYRKRISQLQHALSFAKDEVPKAPLHDQVMPVLNAQDISISEVMVNDPVLEESMPVPVGVANDPAFLQDMVNEQKAQVQFLQQQLETRIRAFHELEQQYRESSDKVARLENSLRDLQSQHNQSLKLLDKQSVL